MRFAPRPITPITRATRHRGAGTHRVPRQSVSEVPLASAGLVRSDGSYPSRTSLVPRAQVDWSQMPRSLHGNMEGTLDIVWYLFEPCAANPVAVTSTHPLDDVKSRERSVGRIKPRRRPLLDNRCGQAERCLD